MFVRGLFPYVIYNCLRNCLKFQFVPLSSLICLMRTLSPPQMITFVCELCPEKVMTLSEHLLKSILSTVELGLQSFGPDVNNLCCDFIQALGSHVHVEQHSASFNYLVPFVKVYIIFIVFIIISVPLFV